MKHKNNAHFIIFGFIFGLSALFFPVASADSIATGRNLETSTQINSELIHPVDIAKYTRVAVLSGEKRADLEKRKLAVDNAYKKWNELKSSADASNNPNKLKALDAAAQAYSQTNLAFVNLQKEILVQSGIVSDDVVLSDVVNALNAITPSAAGPKLLKKNNHRQSSMRSENPASTPLP